MSEDIGVTDAQPQMIFCMKMSFVFLEKWGELPSLKLTFSLRKWMVERRSFPFGKPIFRCYVSGSIS